MNLNKATSLNFLSLAILTGFAFTDYCSHAGVITFSNTNAIVINDSASPPTKATPYPSPIQVTGLAGTVVSKVTVQGARYPEHLQKLVGR